MGKKPLARNLSHRERRKAQSALKRNIAVCIAKKTWSGVERDPDGKKVRVVYDSVSETPGNVLDCLQPAAIVILATHRVITGTNDILNQKTRCMLTRPSLQAISTAEELTEANVLCFDLPV